MRDLSSLTGDWTRVPCIGRRIPSPWTTREAHWQEFCSHSSFFIQHMYLMLLLFLTCCQNLDPSGHSLCLVIAPFPSQTLCLLRFPLPRYTRVSPAGEDVFGCCLITWFTVWLHFFLLLFLVERAIYFPPGSPVVEMGKYASWPSASRKTVPSLEKSQTLLWWGVVCSLGPCHTPTQGAHTGASLSPLGGSTPFHCSCTWRPPTEHQHQKITIFPPPIAIISCFLFLSVYPKRCKISGYLIGTLCFPTWAFCRRH